MITREATETRLVLQHRPIAATLISVAGLVVMVSLLVRLWGTGALTREGEIVFSLLSALLAYFTYRSGRLTTVTVDVDRGSLWWRQLGLNGVREERFDLAAIDEVRVGERRSAGRRSANVRYRAEVVFSRELARDPFPFIRDHLPGAYAFEAARAVNAMLERYRASGASGRGSPS